MPGSALCSLQVHEVGKLIKHIMLLNAPLMRTLVTSNLEKGVAEAAPSGHWASVLGAISLSEAQRRDILAVFSMYRGLIVKARHVHPLHETHHCAVCDLRLSVCQLHFSS